MTEDQYIEIKMRELKSVMVEMAVAFYRICEMFDLDVDEIRQRAAVDIVDRKMNRMKCDRNICAGIKTDERKH